MKKWCCIVTVVVASLPSWANTGIDGMNLQQLRPPSDGHGIYSVAQSEVGAHLEHTYGMWAHISRHLASAVMPARGAEAALVSSQLAYDFQYAVSLWERMTLGMTVPIPLHQQGTNFNTFRSYSDWTRADMRMDAKLRLSRDRAGSVGTAILSTLSLPTGNRRHFTGDGSVTWEGRLIADKSMGPVQVAANIGYRVLPARTVLSTEFDDRITYGVGAMWRVPSASRRWVAQAELAGEVAVRERSELSSPLEARAGIGWRWRERSLLHAGAGYGITDAYGSPSVRLIAGIQHRWGGRALSSEPHLPMSVRFAFDDAQLDTAERRRLKELARYLNRHDAQVVQVVGHTDDVGSVLYNQQLGEWRAEAVSEYLQHRGVSSEQLRVHSAGETRPLGDNRSPSGRAKNRRVEMSVLRDDR